MRLLTSHESVEWYTPPWLIDRVREFLGVISLDPASSELPQSWIKAERYFTAEQDGLSLDWHTEGKPTPTIFVNPPYGKTNGKSNQAVWTEYIHKQYVKGHFVEGLVLINNTAGYKWFETFWERYATLCLRERLRFVNHEGKVGGQAKRGQCLIYLGKSDQLFAEKFKDLGKIILP